MSIIRRLLGTKPQSVRLDKYTAMDLGKNSIVYIDPRTAYLKPGGIVSTDAYGLTKQPVLGELLAASWDDMYQAYVVLEFSGYRGSV